MCDLFSSSQDTQQKSDQSQTGQSSTQSNIWNQISPYLQQYMQQYSPGNIASTGTPNSTQTTAASNQTGIASGASLAPGQTAASNIATSGLTPDQIQSYMSPYISSVVNPTIAAQNQQNQQALSNLRGNQAARGALGNNTGSEAAYLAGVQPAQQAQIANLYNQGYNTAANTAATSAGLQLSGAGQLGNLANVGTNANTALYGIGSGLYNTSLTPYSLYNQGVSGLSGLGGLAGSNTQSSGTSTGTSSGTTTSNPSLGSVLLGGLGTVLSGFGSKGLGSLFGGSSTTPGTAANGGWTTTTTPSSSWWPFAAGGSVKAYADGGGVGDMEPFHPHDDMATKVAKGVRAIHRIKKEMGGMVPFSGTSPGMMQPPRYDDGGAVSSVSSSPPSTPASSSSGSDWSSYLPTYSSGVWAGRAPTALQRFGAALTQVGDGPFAGFGKSILEQQGMRYKDLEAQRAAQSLGMEAQRLGMEKELQPSRVSEAQSNAVIAAHNADMNYTLNLLRQKGATENELAAARARMMYNLSKEMTQGQVDATSSSFRTPDGKTWQSNPDGTVTEVTQ